MRGCKCEITVIPGRVLDGSQLAIHQTLSIKYLSSCCSRACVRHAFIFRSWVRCTSPHPTYPFWHLSFVFVVFLFSFVVFTLFSFWMLSLKLCSCSSADHVPDWSRVYYWVCLKPDRFTQRTQTYTQRRCRRNHRIYDLEVIPTVSGGRAKYL